MKMNYILGGAITGLIVGFIVGIPNFLCSGENCLIFVLLPPILGSISYYFTDYFTALTNQLPKILGLFVYSLLFSIPYIVMGGIIGWIIKIKKK